MRSITALPLPAAQPAPSSCPSAPPLLRLVTRPDPGPRAAPAQRLAALAAGLTLGFLLVAVVSLPLGLGWAAADLRLSGLCALVAVPALTWSRRAGRRRAAPGPATRRARRSSTR